MIKNAEALEKMNKVNALVVDKTGTLTEGKPMVKTIAAWGEKYTNSDVINYVVAINSNSEHPLAKATVAYGQERAINPLKTANFKAITGKGVKAEIDNKRVLLGNVQLMLDEGIEVQSELQDKAKFRRLKLGSLPPQCSASRIALSYTVC